jgi:hypothetical protein
MGKVCGKCNTYKNEDDFGYRGKYLHSYCNSCKKEYTKEWRDQNQIRMKKYREDNKGKISSNYKKWADSNKQKRDEYIRNWVEQNYTNEHKSFFRKNWVSNLKDGYIKMILRQKGFTKEHIKQSPELLTIQKTILQIQRYAKNNSNKS